MQYFFLFCEIIYVKSPNCRELPVTNVSPTKPPALNSILGLTTTKSPVIYIFPIEYKTNKKIIFIAFLTIFKTKLEPLKQFVFKY